MIIKHGKIHEERKGLWAFSSWLSCAVTDWLSRQTAITWHEPHVRQWSYILCEQSPSNAISAAAVVIMMNWGTVWRGISCTLILYLFWKFGRAATCVHFSRARKLRHKTWLHFFFSYHCHSCDQRTALPAWSHSFPWSRRRRHKIRLCSHIVRPRSYSCPLMWAEKKGVNNTSLTPLFVTARKKVERAWYKVTFHYVKFFLNRQNWNIFVIRWFTS